ncbi:MAG TPA: TPM domain-containing protein [Burkholderiales bacterium]|nr:TPM domain-containing protein [Burkholderiales bacterium]
MRWLHHLFLDHFKLKRAFPRATLDAIGRAVAEQEKRHRGELRVAIEGGLPLPALLAGRSARERALEQFARLRVWDTVDKAGVLVYLLLADRRVEIVADRGIHEVVGDTAWETICGVMQQEFAAGRYEAGVLSGLASISDLLARHFPANPGVNPNELQDAPVVL